MAVVRQKDVEYSFQPIIQSWSVVAIALQLYRSQIYQIACRIRGRAACGAISN